MYKITMSLYFDDNKQQVYTAQDITRLGDYETGWIILKLNDKSELWIKQDDIMSMLVETYDE